MTRLDPTALSDGDLARQAMSGTDAGAAEAELCTRFARRVRLYGQRHLGNSQAAADLAQRAMLVMIEKLRSGAVREPERIGSFILGIARMLVHEGRRAPREQVGLPSEDRDVPHEPGTPADPFLSARLAQCLASLSERERGVVVLTYYGEASSRDIAERLAVAEGHVRVIRHRAITRLRGCLEDVARGPAEDGLSSREHP